MARSEALRDTRRAGEIRCQRKQRVVRRRHGRCAAPLNQLPAPRALIAPDWQGTCLSFAGSIILLPRNRAARGDLGWFSRLTRTRVGGTNADTKRGHAFSSWKDATGVCRDAPAAWLQGIDGPDNCH